MNRSLKTHLILDLLRRNMSHLLLLATIGFGMNILCLAVKGMLFPSCILASLAVFGIAVYLVFDGLGKTVWRLLPIPPTQMTHVVHQTSILILPLIGIILALPFFMYEQYEALRSGGPTGILAGRFLLSCLASFSIAGIACCWSVLFSIVMLGTLNHTVRRILIFPLASVPGVLGISFLYAVYYYRLPPSPGVKEIGVFLPGIVAAAVSLPLIRYRQHRLTRTPQKRKEEEAPEHPHSPLSPMIAFDRPFHPLLSLCQEAVVSAFSYGLVFSFLWYGIILVVSARHGQGEDFLQRGDEGGIFVLNVVSLLALTCLLLVPLTFSHYRISAFRAIRTLPLSSTKLSVFAAGYLSCTALAALAALAGMLLVCRPAGLAPLAFRTVLRYTFAANGLMLVFAALALHYGSAWRIVFFPVLFVVLFAPGGASPALRGLLDNPLYSNIAGFLLILASTFVFRRVITRSSRIYEPRVGVIR